MIKQIKCIFTFLLSLLLLTHSLAAARATDELPDLGERSTTFISPKMEKELGREFMREVRKQLQLVTDPIIHDYIQNLGAQLTDHTSTKNKQFHFFVVKDQDINAFAGPDAHIGVNSGTITTANSESELAGVLAHEIAHVSQHHVERLIETAKNTQLAAMAGTLAAIIIGSTSSSNSLGNIATGATMASMGGATQHLINFTREHEIEADNIGMKILYNSNFDPRAIPNFFERVQRQYRNYTNDIPKILMTHPVTNDRIAEARNRVAQYHLTTIKPQDNFYLVRSRTEVLTTNNLTATIKQLQLKLKNASLQASTALQYGLALALYQNKQLTPATTITSKLCQDYPDQVLFQMLAAKIALTNKQTEQAIAILKTALNKQPDYYPLIIQYGQTLLLAKQPQAASIFLKMKAMQYSKDPNLYLLISDACAQSNQKADAYLAKAKAYTLDGYYRQAGLLLTQALKTPQLTANTRAIINARLEQLKELEQDY